MRNLHRSTKHVPSQCVPNSRQGTVAVELALVLPIILLLFFGGLELTSLNLVRHTAGNASYEAARKVIVPGGDPNDAVQEAMRVLSSVGAVNDVDVDVQDLGTKVTVTISIPVEKNSWGLTRFSSGMTITQSCSLSRQL